MGDLTDDARKGAFEPEKPTKVPDVEAPEPPVVGISGEIPLDPFTATSLFIEVKPGLSINVDQITDFVRIHLEKEDMFYVIITLSNGKQLKLDNDDAEVFMASLSKYRPILIRHGMLELPSEAVLTGEDESIEVAKK